MEKVDNRNLLLTWEGEVRDKKGQNRKFRVGLCLYTVKKFSFPLRSMDTWNGLKGEIAKCVHQMKE